MGKLDSHREINEVRTLPYTIHKDKSIWLIDLKIIRDTIKLLEENIGKTFSDINCTNIFLGQSPKAIEIKTKINKLGLIKLTSLLHSTGNHKQNEKTTYK